MTLRTTSVQFVVIIIGRYSYFHNDKHFAQAVGLVYIPPHDGTTATKYALPQTKREATQAC
jgi:hypothetical protein